MLSLQPTGKTLFHHFHVTSHHSSKYLCPVGAPLCSLRGSQFLLIPSASSSLVCPPSLGLNEKLNLFVFPTTRISLGGQSGPMEEYNPFKNSSELQWCWFFTEFFPNTNIYKNEIKEKTNNTNSRSNLKERPITLFISAHCSTLFLHHSYFGNENFFLVSDNSLFSLQQEGKLLLNWLLFLSQTHCISLLSALLQGHLHLQWILQHWSFSKL